MLSMTTYRCILVREVYASISFRAFLRQQEPMTSKLTPYIP